MTDYFSAAAGLDQIGSEPQSNPGTLKGGISPRYDQSGNLKTDGAGGSVQPVDYFTQAAGLDKIGQTEAPSTPKPKESWSEWLVNSVKGHQDPKEADTKTIFEQYPAELRGPTGTAAIFGAGDDAMADIIAKNLGDKYIRTEKDMNGYPIIVTRGSDGQEMRGYVNRPGLDSQDIARAGYGSLPYLAVGGGIGAAMRGLGAGIQAIAQGAGAGATSVGGDVANVLEGSEQGIDVPKAAVMASLGAAGPVVGSAAGALYRRFITIPGLIDKNTGLLTQKGIEAARQAGVDPAQITPDFAKSFAEAFAASNNPAEAATKAGLEEFGIPATRGQVTKDPYLLTQEEGMRRRLYGEPAQNTMRAFDQQQQDAIRSAALGPETPGAPLPGSTAPKQGIGEQLNPGRQPGANPADLTPQALGNSVQDTLQAARNVARNQERALWTNAGELKATQRAFDILPDVLNRNLGDVVVDTQITPTATRMAQELDRFIAGEAPEPVAGVLKQKPVPSVNQMRKRLFSIYKGADTPEDSRAAKAIYDGYNDWIGEAASQSLLDGDPQAAMQIVKARGFTKAVRELFEPRTNEGNLSPAGQRIAKIMDNGKADSGEAVIETILGSQGSRSVSTGTVGALKNIKQALDKFANPAEAQQAWNDIRLAYWSRLISDKSGRLLGPQAMVSNLKAAFHGQSSLMQTLYTPAEMMQMRAFERALTNVAYKPPNASGSGYTAASFIKDGLLKILDAFGIGKPAMAVFERSGIPQAWNAAAAKQAIRSFGRPVRPNVTPALTAAGQALYQGQSGGGR